MSVPKKLTALLTASPLFMEPPESIQPTLKRTPCATRSTTPSIITATKRIQKPADLRAVATGVKTGAGGTGVMGGGGNTRGPTVDEEARSAPHREQYRAFSPCHPQRSHVTSMAAPS